MSDSQQITFDDEPWPPRQYLEANAPAESPVTCHRERNEAWCPDCRSRVTISAVDGRELGHGANDTSCKRELDIDRSRAPLDPTLPGDTQ